MKPLTKANLPIRRVYDDCTFYVRHEIPYVSVENKQNVFLHVCAIDTRRSFVETGRHLYE